MNQCACGKPTEPGRAECFHCRVSTIGVTWRGGAREGHAQWHRSKHDYLRDNLHVGSEKELARRSDVERAPP